MRSKLPTSVAACCPQAKGEMDAFAEFVAASAAAPADFERIARYYQDKGQLDKAADMWSKCDQYPKALQLYLKVRAGAVL